MSGSFGDMGNLLKQAQAMQRELDRVQRELAAEEVEGTAGAGFVRVRVSGEGQVTAVELSDEVVAGGDKAMLEDLLLAALRDGLSKASKLRQERLSRVTGGLNLPGLF
jgi:DNA-binding YbaB/EbfC family protein